MTRSFPIILLVWPVILWATDWDPTSPASSIGFAVVRQASLISCRFEPLDNQREGWARAIDVQVLSGQPQPESLDLFVGTYVEDLNGKSTWFALLVELPETMEKSYYLLPAEGVPISTRVVINHPVMGPFLLLKTQRLTDIMASIVAEPESPKLDRAMLWSGFKQESGQNRRFCEVEFAWRFPPYEETNRIIKDSDLPIVTQIVETDGYSKGFHHYMMSFAFVEHRRFEPEWLMEIVRKHLENGMLWPIQQDVIITYGTAQDIDKVATVCVADRPPGAILIGASILAARRPEEARRFIQRQLDSHNVRTEYREVMEEILAKIGTDTKAD